MAIRNTQDGISVVQTAEGALTEVHSLLQRMRELAVQAASTGSSDPASRAAAQAEVSQLLQEVNRISDTTRFGGQNLLNGTYGEQQRLTGTDSSFAAVTVAAGDNEVALTFVNSAGANQTVQVALNAGLYSTGESLASEFNRAISAAINAVDPGMGNAVSVQFVVNTDGTGSHFEMVGQDAFTTADGADATNAAETHLDIANATSTASGSGGVFQVGASAGETITFTIGDTDTTALQIATLNVATNAQAAISSLDDAIQEVSVLRGDLGALQNRFEHTINNLSVTAENLAASESRIRDTDMASEMMQFTRAQILQQAGTAMLAQANALPQSVLQLLQ
jgi:flagellin